MAKTKAASPKPRYAGKAAIEKIANSTISHVRLPMLDVIFDRSVQLLTESFLHLIAADVRFTLDEVEYGRFGDFVATGPDAELIAVVRAVEWDGTLLVAFDASVMMALVEILLGGDPEKVTAAELPSRPSAIEMRLTQRIMEVIAQRLSEAFSSVTRITFEVERIELNKQFAAITRSTSAAVEARINLSVANLQSRIAIIFPQTTIEPVKSTLQQMFLGERLGRDDTWSRHFAEAVTRSVLSLEAVLHTDVATLEDILEWQEGTTLTFDTSAEADVRLMCDEDVFFRGPMGRKGGRIAVRIEESMLTAAPSAETTDPAEEDDDKDQEEAA